MAERGFDYGFKVIVYGDRQSGKDCLLNRFMTAYYPGTKATNENYVIKQVMIHGKKIRLFLCNMGVFGKDLVKNPKLEVIYQSSADVVILCVDPLQTDAVHNLPKWVKELNRAKRKPERKLVLAITKLDDVSSFLPRCQSFPHIVQKHQIETLEEQKTSSPFARLPIPVIHNILSNLSLTTIRDCMVLNSFWFEILNENEFWKKIYELHFNPREGFTGSFKDLYREEIFAEQWPQLIAVKEWAKENKIPYYETSAKINKGVDSLFAEIIQPLVEQRLEERASLTASQQLEMENNEDKESEQNAETPSTVEDKSSPELKGKTQPENKTRQTAIFECPATLTHKTMFKKQLVSSGLLLIVDHWLYIQQEQPPYKLLVEIDIKKVKKISPAGEDDIQKTAGVTILASEINPTCTAGVLIVKKSGTMHALFVPPMQVSGLLVEIANKLV